jgi:ATP-binding cassette, subfamily F, member 3
MQAFVDRFRYKASKARQAQSRLKALAKIEPIATVVEESGDAVPLSRPARRLPPRSSPGERERRL